MPKNTQAKTRDKDDPYEVWTVNGWTWNVLKKWQYDDRKPYGRWFCFVTSPFVPEGEYGDVYVDDIRGHATCIKAEDPERVGLSPQDWRAA